MKGIKRLIAVIMVLAMVISVSACSIHKKGEIAVTVEDLEFTSAYYICALLNANSEAQQKVTDAGDLTEAEQSGEAEIDFFAKKIDDKKFADWVEDRALEIVKEHAAYKLICKEKKLELTEEKKKEVQDAADLTWNGDESGQYQAAGEYYELNGVSKETFDQFMINAYYADVYFDSLYGKDGTKAIAEKEVIKEIEDNYILVDVLQSTYGEEDTAKQKAAKKKLLQKNAEYIKSGEKTFAQTYREFNNVSEEEHEHEHEEGELHPNNEYATLLGSEKTDYASEYYDKFKNYKLNVPKVIDLEDDAGAALVIRRSIIKDEYYKDGLDTYARHSLKDEEFKKEIAEYVKNLKFDVSSFAIGQYSAEDIETPVVEAAY